ncbi:MAG: transcription termination/antitermination NusG family protein [Lachnospiraceae bacterium]
MWYVIQTISGEEAKICAWINLMVERELYTRCFVPLYEDVYRKGGIGHVDVKRMFAGYLFIETDQPQKIYDSLKSISGLSAMLADTAEGKQKNFLPIREEEEQFLQSVLKDGLMSVSYIKRSPNGKIEELIGPLERYRDYIIKVDVPHRRAIVRLPFFSRDKQMKFGLWTDADPKLAWIEEEKARRRLSAKQKHDRDTHTIISLMPDIQEGDYVINTTGIYGDLPLRVTEVIDRKRSVMVEMELFGRLTGILMNVDDIKKT